jgi:biotin operon repressor
VPNTSREKQVDNTVKLLLMLLVEPRLSQPQLAKVIGVTPGNVMNMIERFREAGLEFEYDFAKKQYVGKFSETLEKTLLGSFAKKLKTAVKEAQTPPALKFVSEIERYTLVEFAQMMGTTPQNIYNMIIGYKGQALPAGWVAYQLTASGKWFLKKMLTDRTGQKFVLPPNIKEAARYVIGSGDPMSIKDKALQKCIMGDGDSVAAKGLCMKHYQDSRRHLEKYAAILKQHGINP